MNKLSLKDLTKLNLIVFIIYVCWFKYPFGHRLIVLYGTTVISCICMTLDLGFSREDLRGYFPEGVLVNLFMCVYSLITGVFVAKSLNILFSQVLTYFAFSMVCMACCYVSLRESSIDWLIDTFVVTAIICGINTVVAGYNLKGYGVTLSQNNNPNTLGLILDVGIFGLSYRCKNKSGLSILINYVLALFLGFSIVRCGSRKCLIGAAVFLAIWSFSLLVDAINSQSIEYLIGICLLLTLTFFIIYIYFKNGYINSDSYRRMLLLGTGDEGSSVVRKSLYKIALNVFSEHPIVGVGYFQFIFYNPYNAYAHSTYAEALACWGLLGSGIYFSFILSAFGKLIIKAVQQNSTYLDGIILALCIMELFLGIGQIFYYDPEHLLAWTIINLYLDLKNKDSLHDNNYVENNCKYLKKQNSAIALNKLRKL